MVIFVSSFLYMAVNFPLVNCAIWTDKTVYRPYRPLMCEEACCDSPYFFVFIRRNLSCQRILINNGDTSDAQLTLDSYTCHKTNKLKNILGNNFSLPRQDECEAKMKHRGQSYSPEVTKGNEEKRVSQKIHCRLALLHKASVKGHLGMVKHILSRRLEDINCRWKGGITPVMGAVSRGQKDIFDFLVSQGCDLSAVADSGGNVLHGKVQIVRELIFHKNFDMECKGMDGFTPVMYAASTGQQQVFNLLVSECCNLKVISTNNETLLHIACHGGSTDIVENILSLNPSGIEDADSFGRTPLHIAVIRGFHKIVNLLASKGCDLTAVYKDGFNALHLACDRGYCDVVKVLLQHNMVLESREERGRTPVMIAAAKGHIQIFDLLMNKGSNLSVTDHKHYSVLHVACCGGHIHMVRHILSKEIVSIDTKGDNNLTPVMTAARQDHKAVFHYLVRKGCNITLFDKTKNNILHCAVFGGNIDIVKYILKQNLFRLDSRGDAGRTPLMVAAKYGQTKLFDFLISVGCNVSVVDKNGNNILQIATKYGHTDIVKRILTQNL